MASGYTTCILHHPARPVDCLIRVLDSLRLATDEPHKVDVVIQGPSRDPLPPVDAYDDFNLTYVQLKRNEGLSKPAAESMARATTRWWAKLDDDMILPPHAWDTLSGGMDGWHKRYGALVAAAMMATGNVEARRLVLEDGKLVEEAETPDNLSMRTRRGTFEATEVLGSGATVFDLELMGEAIAFDPAYHVGGADIDLCMQIGRAGLAMLLCTWPKVSHIYRECTSDDYERIRWSEEDLEASRSLFEAKWDVRPPF